jgi:hypothetical protein
VARSSSFSTFSTWTGASGGAIGYADQYPADRYGAFTADPIHGEKVNPNNPNSYMQKGALPEGAPVQIQSDYDDWSSEGSYGWVLDNLDYPAEDDPAGTMGHDSGMGPAKSRSRDAAHARDVYQEFPYPGIGQDFYGASINVDDLHAWKSSSVPNFNSGVYPADAREITHNWPEPFDSTTVAPLRNNPLDTEKIPMRRMDQDDRPLYRYLAVPGGNIQPSGSVYNPQYESNVYVQNVTAIPAAGQTPVDPWASQDILSAQAFNADDEIGIGGGWQ